MVNNSDGTINSTIINCLNTGDGIVYKVTNGEGVRYSNDELGRPGIGADTVTLSQMTFTYNGQEQRPEVTVTMGEETLTAGTDYTVAYPESSVNAGDYEITVTGTGEGNKTGSYVGSVTVTYTIEKPAPTGGGSSSPTYRPDVAQPEGGAVSVSPQNPHRGDDATITPEPEEGFEVDEFIVTDRNGNDVEVTDNGDGTFSFTQPSGKVTIEVTFRETEPEPLPFADVPAGAWYEDAVRYVYENGLMTGTSRTTFTPNDPLTRAMTVTILARRAGVDTAGESWYEAGRQWAMETGVSDGTNMAGDITREQLAAMLYRAAGSPAVSGNLSGWADAENVSPWAQDAIAWAVETGIISGTSATTLSPQGTATRAQAAVILMRFFEWNK